jgi:hypothetical protein
LKVEGTDKTFQCSMAGCGKIVQGKSNMGQHIAKHDREDDTTNIENRRCKLKGCEGMDHLFYSKRGYSKHEVSVVLETNGRFTQLTMSHLANQRSSTGTGWKVCW